MRIVATLIIARTSKIPVFMQKDFLSEINGVDTSLQIDHQKKALLRESRAIPT
jgi:hypothetical protein